MAYAVTVTAAPQRLRHPVMLVGRMLLSTILKILKLPRQAHAVDQLVVNVLLIVVRWRYNQPDQKLYYELLWQLHWTCSRDDCLQHTALP